MKNQESPALRIMTTYGSPVRIVMSADGWTIKSPERAVCAEQIEVGMSLAGEVERVIAYGQDIHGPADGPQREVHFLPEEIAEGGPVVTKAAAVARAAWEEGARTVKPQQAFERPQLHRAILKGLEADGGEMLQASLSRTLVEPGVGMPSETTLRKALNLLESQGKVKSRTDPSRNGRPTLWNLATAPHAPGGEQAFDLHEALGEMLVTDTGSANPSGGAS